MAKSSPGVVSFNAGEASPRLYGRTDLEKYGKLCRELVNTIPLVQGGASKRSGTRFVREPAPSLASPLVALDSFTPTATLLTSTDRGMGFDPKFAVFFTTQTSGSTGQTRGAAQISLGMKTASGPGVCFGGRSNDAAAAATCGSRSSTNALAVLSSTASAADGATEADFIGGGSIRYRCVSSYAATVPRLSVWAVGGDVIRAAEIVTIDTPTTAGQVTVQGANPSAVYDFAIFIANGQPILGAAGRANLLAMMGMCDPERQGVVQYAEADAVDPTNSAKFGSTLRCVELGSTSGSGWASAISASRVRFEENRLVLDFSTVAVTSVKVSVLLVDSQGSLTARSFTTPASTGAFTALSGLSGFARGGIFASSISTDSSAYENGAQLALQAFTPSSNSGVQAAASTDNVVTTEVSTRYDSVSALSAMAGATPTVNLDLDFAGAGANSITLNCTTALSGRLVLAAVASDILNPVGSIRLFPWKFNEDDAYVLEFENERLSFYRNGQSLTEAAKVIEAATNASSITVTITGHGYSDGDEIFISGMLGMVELSGFYILTGSTANTFSLIGVDSSGFGVYTGGGTSARVYKIVSPYSTSDLDLLQPRAGLNDVLYIAHPDFAPRKLSRLGNTSWTLTEVVPSQFPFSPENKDENSFVAASAVTGTITLTSSAGIFTADMIGERLKLREVAESMNPEWKAKVDFDQQEYSAFQANTTSWEAGDRLQYEGRVYETSRVFGATGTTGSTPPVHENGYASDGDMDFRFVNYGYGYARITAFTDAWRVSATVEVEMPKSVVSVEKSVTAMSVTNPISVNVAAHGWETGDRVYFRGVSGTFGGVVNNQTYAITRTGTGTFTIPVNGAGLAGGVGVAIRMAVSTNATGVTAIYPSLYRWSWGAWGPVRGYPRAVSFFEDRLCWGGTRTNPQTVWCSVVGDYEDHRTFDEDDSALVFTLASSDPIQWMVEQNALLIGTSGSEFGTNRNAAEPLTPETVATIRSRSRYGARPGVWPVAVDNAVLFAQRAGRKLRELVWDEGADSLVAGDMTRLADHVTLGLIRELSFQAEPDRVLWAILDDGKLIGFTYETAEQVSGWHRHELGGTDVRVLSIATIPHPDGDGDQTWLLVERTVNGETRRYVEYLEKQWTRDQVIEDAVFVDSSVSYYGAPASLFQVPHLEGEQVRVLVDGLDVGLQTVSGGQVTTATAGSAVTIGLPYAQRVTPMRLEAGASDGTAQGKNKRVKTVVVRVDQTGRGLFLEGPSGALEEVVLPEGVLTDGDSALTPFPGGYDFDGLVPLVHGTALPCTITGIYPQLSTEDR